MKNRVRSTLWQILKLALAVGLITFLLRSGRFNLESLKVLYSLPVLAAGFATLTLILFFASERWRVLLKQQDLKLTAFEAFRLTLIGTFFNFFVPGGVGGDVMKAVLIAQDHKERRGEAVLTVLADRILGLFTMTMLALIAFSFEPELLGKEPSFRIIFLALAAIFIIFLFGFWALLSTKATGLRDLITRLTSNVRRLAKLWSFAQTYKLTPLEIAKVCFFSIGAQALQILLFVVVAQQMKTDIPAFTVFLFAVPVGFMVTAIPIAPAGVGIGQAAFFFLFSKAAGFETEIGVIGITAFQFFQLCLGVIGAIFFVLMKRKDPKLSLESLENQAEQGSM